MKFFSKILKQKKSFLLLAVSLFVITSLAVPGYASAGWFDWLSTDLIVNGILSGILIYFFWVPLLFSAIFATITNILLQGILALAIGATSYTNSPAVQIGWPIVRDLSNMFIVIGFVVIGLAFILRIESYGSKKVLINLIIAALLINFSKLLCGIFIDGTNILMVFFFSKTGAMNTWLPVLSDVYNLASNMGDNSVFDFAPKFIGMAVFYFIAGFVNLLYALLVLARIVAIWILVILSPLAFVSYVFPFSRGIFQMWWKNFFQWCIVIVPAGLFYYIGSQMVYTLALTPGTTEIFNTSTGDWKNIFTNMISVILVPSLFLIIGFLISIQTSAMGASAITSFASKTGKAVGGSALKGLADKSGASRVGAWAKDKATSIGERYNLASKGTTAANQQKRLGEAKKRLENITDNSQLAKIAEQRAITHQQALDKAAAADVLAGRKSFDSIDAKKRESVAAHASAFGVPKENFTKVRPETFAGGSSDNEATAYLNAKNAPAQVSALMASGMTKEAAEKAALTGRAYTADEINDAKIEMRNQKVTQNALGVAPISDKDVTNKLVEERQKRLIATAKAAGRDLLPEEAMTLAKNYEPSKYEMATTRDSLAQERIAKGFAKLSGEGISKLPKEALTSKEFRENIRPARISQASRFLSSEQVGNIQDAHMTELKKEMVAIQGQPQPLNAADTEKLQKLTDLYAEIRDLG